jgi:SAM-dependent methyltransferase
MAEAGFFIDGAAYDRLMGRWSRAAGEQFLDWLSLPQGLRWLDAGCGTGAFTSLVLERCAPGAISALDPSDDQIAYAKKSLSGDALEFRVGDAQCLPFADRTLDIAVMALVIPFLPDTRRALAELKRVTRQGGVVAAYQWDTAGNAYTQQPLIDALATMGIPRPSLGSGLGNTGINQLSELFRGADLCAIATRIIDIQLTFDDFEDYWSSETGLNNAIVRPIRDMPRADVKIFKRLLREQLPIDRHGRISYRARATAIKAQRPD